MSFVGFYSAHLWYPVGSSDLLHSFFSTVSVRLEDAGWGSGFPVLMGDLYDEGIAPSAVAKALHEWARVRAGLGTLPASAMVWDCEDLDASVPLEYTPPTQAETLLDCFTTCEGENLVDMLGRALTQARQERAQLRIATLEEAGAQLSN